MGILNLYNGILLFFVAILGGAMNSVAGGGSFFCFPALLFTGMPPIQANATTTTALWPGTLASVGAYWNELRTRGIRPLIPLICTGLAGGLCGSLILLKTPQATFLRMVPYLLAGATVLFMFSGRITRFVRRRSEHLTHRTPLAVLGAAVIQLGIAIYIGFFGAGAGFLILAMLSLMGLENIHLMNGYRTLLVSVCNGIAIVAFIVGGAVVWPQAILMLVGAVVGGYLGAYFAQKMNPQHVRYMVIAVGAGMSIYFFIKQGF